VERKTDMRRPCENPDAILWHVASWGDRCPQALNTAKEIEPVNRKAGSADAAMSHLNDWSIPFGEVHQTARSLSLLREPLPSHCSVELQGSPQRNFSAGRCRCAGAANPCEALISRMVGRPF